MAALVLLVEAAFVALLVFLIVSLVRSSRRAVVQRAPLLPDQPVLLSQPGPLKLCLEGPAFSTYSTRLTYALFEAATGWPIPVVPTSFGVNSSNFTRQRVTRAAFTIPNAGWYRLVIGGFQPGRDYRDYAVVVTRPYGGTLVAHILGIVFVGLVVVGGLVTGLLLLASG